MPPTTIRLYSEDNHFQHAQVLARNRQKRQRYRELFVEGVRPINQLLAHGWPVNAWYYSSEKGLSDWATNILRRSRAATHFDLPAALLARLSEKDEISELIAILAMPEDDLARILIRNDLLLVAFDRPASPGNLGTLIRSADALGAHGVIISGHAADLYDPETIRASTGSIFAVPCVRIPSHYELRGWMDEATLRIGPIQTIGADEKGGVDVWEHDFTGPTVLALGNETWGLSAAYREMCDHIVRIPMSGSASSLNVACAASILLYEMARQRR